MAPPRAARRRSFNAEDDAATTRSRLAAAAADMSRVVVWSPGLGESAPHLPDHIDPFRDLGITFKKIGNQIIGQTVYWLMPGQRVPKEAYHPDGVDEWLDRLDAQQEQFRNLRNRKVAE